ncbi:MAG: ABC transporter substrate-binding protein [Clostridiales Family XIII bacterium]|jgi:NitT/TauT family transport system substrate-binding protein|nr:ABC transporter substrate-binding protein [Clostridiales Family XIII bacterium]
MKTNKKITGALALIFALILALGLTACGGADKDAGSGDSEYKYGKIQIPGKDGALCGAPIYIAFDQGFFAEEGFDVELISADAETRKIGLNNGTIPIVNGDFQFFPSIEEGVNVSVVDGLHNGCIKFIVKKGSPIKTASDLKGKRIAVDEIGGTPHQVASVWVEKAGISAKPEDGEVEFVVYSDGNLEIEALKNGDVDVAALWDPLGSVYTEGEHANEYEVLFDLSTDPTFAGKYCCFLYASNKVIKDNPEQVSALLRAYHKAQEWISENPKEAVDIISDKKYSDIEDKVLAEALVKSYEYPSAHDHATNKQDVGADVLYFATELYDIGYLKTDPAEFVKTAYYKVDLDLGK